MENVKIDSQFAQIYLLQCHMLTKVVKVFEVWVLWIIQSKKIYNALLYHSSVFSLWTINARCLLYLELAIDEKGRISGRELKIGSGLDVQGSRHVNQHDGQPYILTRRFQRTHICTCERVFRQLVQLNVRPSRLEWYSFDGLSQNLTYRTETYSVKI